MLEYNTLVGVIRKYPQVQRMAKGGPKAARGKGKGPAYIYNKGQHNQSNQRLSPAELKLFKEFAKERQEEKEKEEKLKAKLDARKHASRMLNKFAKDNNLSYKDGDISSSDSSSDEGDSAESDASERHKKKKKKIKRRQLKDKQIQKRKAQEDKIKELEATVQELKEKQDSSQQERKPKKQARSEGGKTSTSLMTTSDQLKKAVAKQMQDGKLPAGFRLPYPAGAKLEFASPQELEQAIDTMVKAAIKKAKAAEQSVIVYDPAALQRALESDTPIQAKSGQGANSRESRRVSPREKQTRKQVTMDDDDLEKQLAKRSKGRIEPADDNTSTLQYNLDKVVGSASKTLESLEADAKLKMQYSKISSAHFKQEFQDIVAPQVDKLVKGILHRSKPQVQDIIKDLELNKYLEKGEKGTLREMLRVMLCAIRALPNKQ